MARVIIMAFNSCSFVGDEKLNQLILGFHEWINTRETTKQRLIEVADELHELHKKLAARKRIGGAAGLGGGFAATVGAFAIGGPSLYVGGLLVGSLGNLTAAYAAIDEYMKNKTGIKKAQKTIDDDRKVLNSLLSKLLLGYKLEQTSDVRTDGSSFVDKIYEIYLHGSTMYGWATKSKEVYSFLQEYRACTSIGELTCVEQLMSKAKFAGPALVALSLAYLVHQIMDINKGNLSDGARAIHEACDKLEQEKQDICRITNALEAEKKRRDNAWSLASIVHNESIVAVFILLILAYIMRCFYSADFLQYKT